MKPFLHHSPRKKTLIFRYIQMDNVFVFACSSYLLKQNQKNAASGSMINFSAQGFSSPYQLNKIGGTLKSWLNVE